MNAEKRKKGRRITSLKKLYGLAMGKKCVVWGNAGLTRPIPATFVMGMTAYTVVGLFSVGMYEYRKDVK